MKKKLSKKISHPRGTRNNLYDHVLLEKKWKGRWEKETNAKASNTSLKEKFYCLVEFPYPSGDGLHVGHARSYTAIDVLARYKRAQGFNVLYPIGWDAFGLPTENFAIKTGKDPKVITKQNTDNYRKQLKSLGVSFDWSREINTTDPEYYKWTQWLFLQFYKHGLAYKTKMPINWCPKDKIGLANEEVVNGKCERCGTDVEKKEKEQWMLAITKYAERLDKDLDTVDYEERIKQQQRNWIGKSEGAEISFQLGASSLKLDSIKVFTTRPETIFGATYLVLAPEHDVVRRVLENKECGIENRDEILQYAEVAKKRNEIERTSETKDKTGVELKGIYAINPATNENIPVWIADYVLVSYGTGAIMAVPAHDERDNEFAKKFNLGIKHVIKPTFIDEDSKPKAGVPVVPRKTVCVLLRDPKTNEFLCLDWKKFGWKTFIIGGVDDDEVLRAAEREIREETGYSNVSFVRHLGSFTSEYFAAHKNENRIADTEALLFDLNDRTQVETNQEETKNHIFVWKKEEEVRDFLTPSSQRYIWDKYKGKDVYVGEGILINSNTFNNKTSTEVKDDIVLFVGGKLVTRFKLRDWVFSRQRYWGEPIPLVHCNQCGIVPIPEMDLPVILPKVKRYEPTDNGESPLASITSWVNTKCPKCAGDAKRETDTMPQWAGSSWYFLRYTDPRNSKQFASKKALSYWMPVDWYNGGMEHTTLHLLYSRFWYKFLFDLKLVPTSEPYKKRTSHGLILAQNGEKMSKSKGNVINPDSVISVVGADSFRLYQMFMGPFQQEISWSEDGIAGPRRFVERVWRMHTKVEKNNFSIDKQLDVLLNKTILKIGKDIEGLNFNTAVSSLMVFSNELEKHERISRKMYSSFLQLLAPFAPFVTEELWSIVGNKGSVHSAPWPQADLSKMIDSEVEISVQVNGKLRDRLSVPTDSTENEVFAIVKESEEVIKWTEDKKIVRIVYVPNKIINILVK